MTQRIRNTTGAFTDRPFQGEGVSLYADTGRRIDYRRPRILGGERKRGRTGWIKGAGGRHDLAAAITKTARRASAADPGAEIAWTIPAEFAGDPITAVTAGAAGAASFQVSGDITGRLTVGEQILVAGSTANDGFYTVRATPSFSGGATTIPVEEAVSDGTADGDVAMPVVFDVRKYAGDVENTIANFRTHRTYLDSNRDEITAILGTAVLLDQEAREGGVVRLRFVYRPSRFGTQPTKFRAAATAGPTSPADATLALSPSRRQVIEIDTPALSDSSAYTYTITAENDAGTVLKELLTGVPVTADATGPPAPTSGSTSAV